MKQQKEKLVEAEKFAFFVPLESLDSEPFVPLLSPEDERQFVKWKLEEQAPAWFFLDAVDELKLTAGKLDRALNRLSREEMASSTVSMSSYPVAPAAGDQSAIWPQCRTGCQCYKSMAIYPLDHPKKYSVSRLSENKA